jgi:hypothetical protein
MRRPPLGAQVAPRRSGAADLCWMNAAATSCRGKPIDIRCVMLDDQLMRTTLDIADDVLQAVKELAAVRGQTAGEVLSALARNGLAAPDARGRTRNGVPLLPRRPPHADRPTMKLVNQLRDDG